jgi:RND family efflux transporter MFP subunit
VTTVKPERKAVRRVIEQPGHVAAFEETPVHVKIAGYVRKIHVDIGDEVKEGALLAELWVPEMEEELKQKEALAAQARAEVVQAGEVLEAAKASIETARALVPEAEAGRKRAQANYERWESEYRRAERLVAGKVIDEQTRDETRNQWKAADAARDEVEAKVKSAEALVKERTALRGKAAADVEVAKAKVQVAEADRRRLAALLEYARVKAPFTGVVTQRKVDTDHFVQPAPGGKGEPLFVVARHDPVRVFVEVQEQDAAWVNKDAPARVRVQGQEYSGKVTRHSWALESSRERILRTEIDLPNPDGKLRPGMYAHAAITVEHANVWTLPAAAVLTQGEQSYCWRVVDGKAVKTPLQTGLSGGGLVEVVKRQNKDGAWEDISGGEEVVSGNAGQLTDGQAVTVAPPKTEK